MRQNTIRSVVKVQVYLATAIKKEGDPAYYKHTFTEMAAQKKDTKGKKQEGRR